MEIVHLPDKDDYVNYINTIDEKFDLICIDGDDNKESGFETARSECILNCLDKVKNGGLLLIDNAERRQYQDAIAMIPPYWERMEFPYTDLAGQYIDLTVVYKRWDL